MGKKIIVVGGAPEDTSRRYEPRNWERKSTLWKRKNWEEPV